MKTAARIRKNAFISVSVKLQIRQKKLMLPEVKNSKKSKLWIGLKKIIEYVDGTKMIRRV